MKITCLKDKLCAAPWFDPWSKKDDTGYPVSERGYVRMDHDGRWWMTSWPIHTGLGGDKLLAEFNAVVDAFRRSFKDRAAMAKWCRDERLPSVGGDEYNAYYIGKSGFYWLRMIDRRGDYNLYLHCYDLATLKEG